MSYVNMTQRKGGMAGLNRVYVFLISVCACLSVCPSVCFVICLLCFCIQSMQLLCAYVHAQPSAKVCISLIINSKKHDILIYYKKILIYITEIVN